MCTMNSTVNWRTRRSTRERKKAPGVPGLSKETVHEKTSRDQGTLARRLSHSRALTLAMAASISPARLAWARNRGCPHGDLRDRAFDRAQLGRFGETIIWRGSIPAPFTGGATSAVVVVDIHRPNAAAIKAAEATKAIAHQSRDKFSKTCCR